MKTEGFYCNGWTSQTVINIIAQQALNSIGDSEGNALANLYQAAAILKMRRQLRNNNIAGGCTDLIESTVCGCCVNCNNAYVVNNAVKRYLKDENKTIINQPPTSVQQKSLLDLYKPANTELGALLF